MPTVTVTCLCTRALHMRLGIHPPLFDTLTTTSFLIPAILPADEPTSLPSLLTIPAILPADEPTSGLDSSTSVALCH
jgi:hypothetical protein